MGVKDPLTDQKCLSCHSTAGGAKNVEASYKVDEGVGCEACHGPGSLYRKNSVMKDQKAAVAVGMLIPDEKTCKNCHKPDTKGHENKFKDFKTEYPKIAHEMPKEKWLNILNSWSEKPLALSGFFLPEFSCILCLARL